MSELEAIWPTERNRVIDLVSGAGIDVSDWGNFKGGPAKAASNPKYCYEWSFEEPGRIVVVNLWYDGLEEDGGRIFAKMNLRAAAEERSGVSKRRTEKLHGAIRHAARDGLPVRVIVNAGTIREDDDPDGKASSVEHRLLDPVPWGVAHYDDATGACLLTRGPLQGRVVDQFSVKSFEAPERIETSGTKFARDPAVRRKALERAKGCCEYCFVPGFTMADGSVFLESHHIIPLGEGGPDHEDNVAALCPNHHREAHFGALAPVMRNTLLERVASAKR